MVSTKSIQSLFNEYYKKLNFHAIECEIKDSTYDINIKNAITVINIDFQTSNNFCLSVIIALSTPLVLSVEWSKPPPSLALPLALLVNLTLAEKGQLVSYRCRQWAN